MFATSPFALAPWGLPSTAAPPPSEDQGRGPTLFTARVHTPPTFAAARVIED